MRRIAPLVLVLILCGLFIGSPAEAISTDLYFGITPDSPSGSTNPGTISYAGLTAPLVGSAIAVFDIVQSLAVGTPGDLDCLSCTLSFSTGSFAGTTSSGLPGINGYLFSGGGSFQIIGGATDGGLPFLPTGTALFTGIPTSAVVSANTLGVTELGLSFQGTLNSNLASHFGLSTGAYNGFLRIDTTEISNADSPFVYSTIQTLIGSGSSDVSHAFVRSVPLPATVWPFAVGFVALAAWWEQRKYCSSRVELL